MNTPTPSSIAKDITDNKNTFLYLTKMNNINAVIKLYAMADNVDTIID
jgi:hypothetical protein